MKNAITKGALAAALALGFAGFAPLAIQTAHANDTAKSDSDQPVTDTWITTKVKAELATTEGVKSTSVDVKTVDGMVTLTGTLATDVAVKKAIAAAESIKGVKKVNHSNLKSAQ
jgi:hyperosmotically inducible protein